jgi:hypothetical protein
METRDEYITRAKYELGEQVFSDLYVGIDNDYYAIVETKVKEGKAISKNVYDSLTEGQRFHFNKHFNPRGDMVL